jgi:hypothetical protein
MGQSYRIVPKIATARAPVAALLPTPLQRRKMALALAMPDDVQWLLARFREFPDAMCDLFEHGIRNCDHAACPKMGGQRACDEQDIKRQP